MRIDQLIFKQPIYTILFGFFIYDLGKFISIFTNYENILRAFGLIIITIGLSRCKFKKRHQIPNYLRNFIYVYQIWLLILVFGTIIRALFQYDSMPLSLVETLRYLAFYEHSPLIHFFPLALRLEWDISLLRSFWRLGIFFFVVNGIILFLFSGVLISGIYNQGQTVLASASAETGYYDIRSFLPLIFVGTSFVGLRYNLLFYNKKLFMILIFLYYVLMFTLVIASGSRGGLIMGFLGLLAPFVGIVSNVRKILISLSYMLLVFILFNNIFNSEVGEYVSGRLFEDKRELKFQESSREFYTQSMIQDFSAKPWDYLFGRGAFGVYELLNTNQKRPDIEWGFLWFILKGGVVYLLLYIMFNLYAMYLGLFKSNNAYCKIMGYGALLRVVALLPFGIPFFGFGFFAGTLISGLLFYSNFRTLNDQQLKAIIAGGK